MSTPAHPLCTPLGVIVAVGTSLAYIAFALAMAARPASGTSYVGWGLYGLGAAILLLNLYISYGRHLRGLVTRSGPREELEFVSGVPLFGDVFVTVGLVLLSPSIWLSVLAAVLVVTSPVGPGVFAAVLADEGVRAMRRSRRR